MPTITTNAPAVVSIEGARRIEKAAKLSAALLPNIVAAAEALEVARTLGKSEQEFFGEIVQTAKAESPKMLAIELLGQGLTGAEVARRTGLTTARVSQLKRERDVNIKKSVERVVNFLLEHGANDRYLDDLMAISGRAARDILKKMFYEE